MNKSTLKLIVMSIFFQNSCCATINEHFESSLLAENCKYTRYEYWSTEFCMQSHKSNVVSSGNIPVTSIYSIFGHAFSLDKTAARPAVLQIKFLQVIRWWCPCMAISKLGCSKLFFVEPGIRVVCFSFFFWLRVLDKAEYSAFESTLNSSIVSYRIVMDVIIGMCCSSSKCCQPVLLNCWIDVPVPVGQCIHPPHSQLVLCEYSKFRIESNSYFSILFGSKRVQLFQIFEYYDPPISHLKKLKKASFLTEWCRFFTLATSPSNQQNQCYIGPLWPTKYWNPYNRNHNSAVS